MLSWYYTIVPNNDFCDSDMYSISDFNFETFECFPLGPFRGLIDKLFFELLKKYLHGKHIKIIETVKEAAIVYHNSLTF